MIVRQSTPAYVEWVVVLCLLGNAFVPPLRLPGYALQVSAAAAPFVFAVCMAFIGNGRLKVWWGFWLVALMGLAVVISTFWSYVGLGVPPDGGDFAEAYKYLQFIPYLVAIQFVDADRFERVARRCIPIAATVVIMVGAIQIISPGSLGFVISSIYGASVFQHDSMSEGNRLFLTGTDPNIGAGIGVFFLLYFSMSFFEEKKIASLIFSCLFVVLVIFTQSRTALAGILFGSVLYGFIYSRANLITRFSILITVVFAGYEIITHYDLNYIIVGLQQIHAGTNESLNVRLGNMEQGIEWFFQSPWLGWGAAKSIHDTIIDSEYALILERYGVFGVAIFGIFILKYIKYAVRSIRLAGRSVVFAKCALLYMFFGLVFMTTNNLFSGYQLMALLILLLCLVRVRLQASRMTDSTLVCNAPRGPSQTSRATPSPI